MLGEKLQPDLHQTVMRLRRHKFVVCGDIKKMFNQIRVNNEDWDCQRIFWREHPSHPLKEYWLTVVKFGLTSSAYLSVKSMKHHIKRIVGMRVMEYIQFGTLLCGIEAVLNSRPITPLSDDPEDMQALTPGHFLIGELFVLPPSFQYANESNVEGRKAWNARKVMMEHFWQRWQNEYLTTLQERKKWRKEKEGVKIGQLVLIRDETLAPAHWKMGRIAELLPGADGLTRNVIIKTVKGAFKRPVQKLCILPVESITH